MPALGIDVGLGLVPNADEVLDLFNSAGVAIIHLLIDCATALKTIGPRNTVEPQEITLGAGADIIINCAVRLAILSSGVRTSMCTVETDTVVIRLVIVNRTPLNRIAWDETSRVGTVVMVEGEDMVQADWHHIIDTGLA